MLQFDLAHLLLVGLLMSSEEWRCLGRMGLYNTRSCYISFGIVLDERGLRSRFRAIALMRFFDYMYDGSAIGSSLAEGLFV